MPDELGERHNSLGPPLHRFNEYIAFTPRELKQIQALGEKPVQLPRSSTIREQGVSPTCVFILLDGWASASVDLENGNRQIAKVHLPGDIMGVPSVSLAKTAETLMALTPVTVSPVPLSRFGQLFAASPRFAAAMFLSAQRERIALIDAMTRMGRTSSSERLAALLLDLYERLSAAGQAQGLQFKLRLIQEEVADILGITSVHVNRSFKSLQNLGLIKRNRQYIKILDFQALTDYARWSYRPAASQLGWLINPNVP